MAEQEFVEVGARGDENEDDDETPGYKAPAAKSLNEIVQMDQEDESLMKYKKALLGQVRHGDCPCPGDPRNLIMRKLCLEVEGRDAIEMDLTQKLDEIKKTKFTVKEGIEYHLKMDFVVQREIVTGLKYYHSVHRKGIKVDKLNCMVGSYGPGKDVKSFKTAEEQAPCGMLARGDYRIKSKFTDDDKNVYLEWEWTLCIKKDWD